MGETKLVARIVVENDQAVTASAATGDALVNTIARTQQAEERIHRAELDLAKAMSTRLSASREVEVAMRAQAAAGKPLELELANLQEKYFRLEAAMRLAAKGGGVPAALAAEATRVRTEIAGVERQIAEATKAGGSSLLSVGSSALTTLSAFSALGLGAITLGGAVHSMSDFLASAVTEAANAEAVERRLNQALATQGHLTDENRERILAYSRELQRKTAFEDDKITAIQTRLIMLGKLEGDQLERATRNTLDAIAAGQSEETVINAVAKAAQGKMKSFGELGIVVKTTGDTAKDFNRAMAEMEHRFSGQAAAALTTQEGKVQALEESWANLKEELGGNFLPVLSAVVDGLRSVSDASTDLLGMDVPEGSWLARVLDAAPLIGGLRAVNRELRELQRPVEMRALEAKRDELGALEERIRRLKSEGAAIDGTNEAAVRLRELSGEKIRLMAEITALQQFVDAKEKRAKTATTTPSDTSDDDEKADRRREKAHDDALRRVRERQAADTQRAQSYVEMLRKEEAADTEAGRRVLELQQANERLNQEAIESVRAGRDDVATKLQQIRANEREIQAINDGVEARKKHLAAEIDLVAIADPQKRKLAELKLAREELAAAILRQRGATGTLTDDERKQLASLDAQIAQTHELVRKDDEYAANAKKNAKEVETAHAHAAQRIGDTLGSAIVDVTLQHEKLGDVAQRILEQLADEAVKAAARQIAAEVLEANVEVGAEAAKGGAKAIAAHADIPFVGIGLGAAAAAAIVALILAQKRFIKLASGAEVRGGVPGVDSVPALLMPEERVVDRSANADLKRFLALALGGRGFGGTQVHLTIDARTESLVPDSDLATARRAEGIVRIVQDAILSKEIYIPGVS